MPYKYIGRSTYFVGKTLWEIVGNLKNFGVGRLIVRSRHLAKYPELGCYRILKVESQPAPIVEDMDNVRRVKVYTDAIFRGKPLPSPFIIERISYKADYILVPKDEEHNYIKLEPVKEDTNLYPKYMQFPPLLKQILTREMKASNPGKEPQLEIIYNPTFCERHKVAKEGDVPTVQFDVGLGEYIHKSPMYKDVV